jgi:hypothetical protein
MQLSAVPSLLAALYGRGSGINGAKSCILGLSWHLISLLKLHFIVGGAPLSNTLWRRQAKKDVNKVHWTAFSKSKE